MFFKHSEVLPVLSDPGQRRGYYTATAQQHPDFFTPSGSLFLDGDAHQALRQFWHAIGVARRFPVDVDVAMSIGHVTGCNPPSEGQVSREVSRLMMQSMWGERPTEEVLNASGLYQSFGKFGIFGKDVHRVLGPAGIAVKVKLASESVAEWAETTTFGKLLNNSQDILYPGHSRKEVIDNVVMGTLFAGLLGTTDMALKCITYQKRDEAHQVLFKENPERYLIELMRLDSAVTSVTALLKNTTTINLEGRVVQLEDGTPAQYVTSTANRDPLFWNDPSGFNPNRADLGEMLSWNGKASDAEARNFAGAPRHCPGYCLSLKVGAAVCAGMMGSFEELYAAGKILADNGKVHCNTFGEHPEPPVWQQQ